MLVIFWHSPMPELPLPCEPFFVLAGTEIHSRLQRGNPESEVRRKRDLTVFWAARNKHKTAGELLNRIRRPFASDR